ncbi:hypothetical protein F5Y13DRAFT_177855 [Hypoxylon sp. FL1857]|nr:hypothetical protein F5Y13DRAFT_177855 [Hypoxylon sp. FL1857]
MSTPFICRQCIARLTQSRVKPVKLKLNRPQLHTQAVSTSVLQPTWGLPEKQRREPSVEHEDTRDPAPQSSSYSLQVSQSPRDESVVVETPQWHGHLKKFIPRRQADVKAVAHELRVTNSQDLKLKILHCLGNYEIVREDLMLIYGLSREEARHAVKQLERLLWACHSRVEAAERLDLFHTWKKNFNELLHMAKGSHLTTKPDAGPTETDDETHTTKQDVETVKDVWHRLSQERRENLWPQMMVSAFRSNPRTLCALVQATFHASWCPSYAVEDLVYLLFRTLDNVQGRRSRHQQVTELIFFLLENCPPRYLVLEQMTIQKVISWLPTSRVVELYEALKRVETPLHPNTMLQFASRLARESKYKVQAADVVHSLSNMPGFDINTPAAASVCTTLLTVKEGELPGDHAAPDELFKMLLDAGFRPNILSLTALMRNFCVRGRVEIAWSIFNLLIERGNEPDGYVFSTLLNGSKRSLDVKFLQRSVDMIEAHKAWSSHLVNDLLDFIYQENESQNERRRSQRKRTTARAWRMMVRLYAKFFDLAPLQKVTLFPLENLLAPGTNNGTPAHLKQVDQIISTLPPRPDALLMQPDALTLVLMLRAHFRTIDNPIPLQAYYRRIRKLLYKRDRTVVNLIKDKGSWIYDIFLRDFLQFGQTFEGGIRMVQNMHDQAKREKERGENILHPPPSVHTYTILMNGLRNHGHTQGVITALNTMIKEGIEPNIVTWNTVIGALLREDHLEDAVRVMRYLKHIGLESNDRTVREVKCLTRHQRRRLTSLLKNLKTRAVDFSDERSFAKSLLGIWEKRESDEENADRMSPKTFRKIFMGGSEIEGSSTTSADGTQDDGRTQDTTNGL